MVHTIVPILCAIGTLVLKVAPHFYFFLVHTIGVEFVLDKLLTPKVLSPIFFNAFCSFVKQL